ncbi:methyltransferase domain-containing protein [Marivibrio halodurans]|uniref:Methyltransferase domain-containing protein n=1 Tax=Marivibrio halodurans TaxID=2039722 RepID=A0A8J7S9C1_9PROT|nr:methyltransferase domain-containing protein [Marivibrio halodurans]MBP5857842.1 methyltransferase domain-containing protein [Marivibrio halodurans]
MLDEPPNEAEVRRIWEKKPALRAIYSDFHDRMTEALPDDGDWLAIGAGALCALEGLGARFHLDILDTAWIDEHGAHADRLPHEDGSLSGIAMLDVLQHPVEPGAFLTEAARVLRPGGRLVAIEPGITPLSWPVHRYLRGAPVEMSADPLHPTAGHHGPYDGNLAVPTLLFRREEHRIAFMDAVPDFAIRRRDWLGLMAYPLSGGFKEWGLMPEGLVAPLSRLEDRLMPWLGLWMAFRLLIVLEKRG